LGILPVAISDWLSSLDTAAAAAKFRSTLLSDAAFFADNAKQWRNMLVGGSNRSPSMKQTNMHHSLLTRWAKITL